MRPHFTFAAAGAAVLLVACVQPAAAATALEGSVFQQAKSTLGSGAPVTGQASNSWSAGSPETLAASATATAVGGTDRLTTHAKIGAQWDSADKGSIDVLDHGWNIITTDPQIDRLEPLLFTGLSGQPDWSYSFVATERSTFDLSFDLSGTGRLFGLGAWDLLFFDGGATAPVVTSLARGFGEGSRISGGFSHDLVTGHQYRVAIRNLEGFSTTGVTNRNPDIIGKETGRFDWQITSGGAVPEPATWAMMITGFGLAGATLRRRARLSPA